MKIPNKLTLSFRKIKILGWKLVRTFVRKFPGLFKGEKVSMSVSDANNFLIQLYPDVASTCRCNNSVDNNFQYDLHIIISAYNVEKYINKCIDSILEQHTQYRYLITVVNDGSKDSTRENLKGYESLTNVEIIDQDNKGYSGARNTALNHIKGRYLMFVDSDDYLEEDAIEILLNNAINNKADIVQGSVNHIDDKNKLLYRKRLKSKMSSLPGEVDIMSQPWGKVFKSELFKNVCFPEGYWYEDTITKFILVPNSNLKISISDIVYNYRHHSGTVMQQNKNPYKELDGLYVTRSVLMDYLAKNKINEYLHDHFLHQVKFCTGLISKINDEITKISVFIILKSLYDSHFRSLGYKSKKFPIIQKALEEGDYKLYCIGCKYYT